jgi:hypothetical protein
MKRQYLNAGNMLEPVKDKQVMTLASPTLVNVIVRLG